MPHNFLEHCVPVSRARILGKFNDTHSSSALLHGWYDVKFENSARLIRHDRATDVAAVGVVLETRLTEFNDPAESRCRGGDDMFAVEIKRVPLLMIRYYCSHFRDVRLPLQRPISTGFIGF